MIQLNRKERTYDHYKVKAYCQSCKRYWTTKAKQNSAAPSKCKYCGSTKTKTKSAWGVKAGGDDE